MFIAALVLTVTLLQPPQRPATPCPPPSPYAGRPYFDFQVQRPAVYLGTDTTRIRPDATQRGTPPYPADFALAQFVVDSLGVPIPGTLKLLITPHGFPMDAVGFAVTAWRYRPARIEACAVAQLVQTPLRWK